MNARRLSAGHKILLAITLLLTSAAVLGWYLWNHVMDGSTRFVLHWIRDSQSHPDWEREALTTCPSAPFSFPTTGFTGYLWGDSFRPGHRHQGIDIFSPEGVGETPIYAAYPGYLSRLSDWKSSLIIRIPDDPLHPGRQIWTYYTHLADPDGRSLITEAFPPGTEEVYVERGTLLGYQGNYSGRPGEPVGVHLHFSIVQDNGSGSFKNELEISNTLDPSPYFGLPLNASAAEGPILTCREHPEESP